MANPKTPRPEQAATPVAEQVATPVAEQVATATFGCKLGVVLAHPEARMPAYAHPDDACFDICTVEEGWVPPGGQHTFDTGLIVDVPEGYGLFVFPRSGFAVKLGARLANCVGVIDRGYPGTVSVTLRNDHRTPFGFAPGDRIAQAALLPVPRVTFEQVDAIAPSARQGGLGSTGA